MEKNLVNLETAKLLSSLGYDEETFYIWHYYFNSSGDYELVRSDAGFRYEKDYPAPNISDALEWIRKKYKVWIKVTSWYTSTKSWKSWYDPNEFDFCWEVSQYDKSKEDSLIDTFEIILEGSVRYVSYDDGYFLALSDALEKFLKQKIYEIS